MNEDQLFGLMGIDTEEERRRINYDPYPIYNHKKDIPTFEDGVLDDADDGNDVGEEESPGQEEWVDELIRLETLLEVTQNSLQKLKAEVRDSIVTNAALFTKSHTGRIPNLTPIDFEIPEEEWYRFIDMEYEKPYITFPEYEEAIETSDKTPIQDLIVEAVERFSSDVFGNIDLELYPDVVEMTAFAEELKYLYDHLIGDQYGSKEAIEQKEKAFAKLVENHEKDESLYYDMLRENFESPEYFQAASKYEYSKREVEYELRGRKQIQESVQLIGTSLSSLIYNAELALEGLASSSQINPEQVKVLLDKQENHPQIEVNRQLALSLALKLSSNYYNESIGKKTNVLRNTASNSVVKRLHDKLIQRTLTRNHVMSYVQDHLHYLKDPSSQRSLELFLNEVGRGAQYMTKEYETMMQDTYRLHSLANEVRREKLETIIEKESARTSYQIVEG
jgi:hypothetical protein